MGLFERTHHEMSWFDVFWSQRSLLLQDVGVSSKQPELSSGQVWECAERRLFQRGDLATCRVG